MVKALARAFRWSKVLDTGVHATLEDLARAKGVAPSYLSRILRLALLAPDIVEAILDGRQREEIRLDDLVSPYRLWLPLGHPLAGVEAIGLDQVVGEPLIMLTVDEIEEATARLMAALSVRPNVAFRTRSVEAVRSLVATGAGVALLPDLVYRPWSLEGDRIEIRDVSGDLPSGAGRPRLAARRAAVGGGPRLRPLGPDRHVAALTYRLGRYRRSDFWDCEGGRNGEQARVQKNRRRGRRGRAPACKGSEP